MTLRFRPGLMSVERPNIVGDAFGRATLTVTILLWAATLLAGCDGSGGETSGSCIPFNVLENEVAAYHFTDSEGGSETVRITILSVSGSIVTMQFEEGGAVRNVQYDISCEVGRNANVSLSAEERFAFFGTGFLPSPKSAPKMPPGFDFTPVPPPDGIPTPCEPAEVTTAAGTFNVDRCFKVFAEGGDYQTDEVFGIFDREPRPLSFGVVKETINYTDGSVRNVELVEWNGI